MLFSVSLHGGVAFYDWAANSAESSLAIAPVVVSFVPTTDVASPAVPERPQLEPDLAPATTKSRVKEVEPPAFVPKVASSTPKSAHAKALPKKVVTPVVTEEPQVMTSSTETVCMAPQEIDSYLESETADSRIDASPVEAVMVANTPSAVVSQTGTQEAEEGFLENIPGEFAQDLVEAIPNYRSNPLPEYPYLARQKHWQGVVWLLVDVSAEGLVEDLRVEQSCGHRILDRAASRTVRRWQFYPAKSSGLPVESQVRIPVRFRLEGS